MKLIIEHPLSTYGLSNHITFRMTGVLYYKDGMMANRRMIYQDFFEDDYFGTREYGIRLLWIGLIAAAADDQGRVLYNTSLIRAKVFMYDDTSNSDVETWLTELAQDNKVVIYVAGGKHLIQITKWWDYQTPGWASPSKYPPPDGWIDRVRCHVSGPTQGGKVETLNWDKKGGFTNVGSELCSYQDSKQDSKQDERIDKLSKDNNKLMDAHADFSAFQKVWEKESGTLVSGFTEFSRMCERFVTEGVTPEIYRTAIQEQKQSSYAVKRPTSVEEWAVRIANPIKNNNGKNAPDPYPDFGIVYDENGVAYNAKGEVVNV